MSSSSKSASISSLLLTIAMIVLVFVGILDCYYLTIKHYSGTIPPCTTGIFADCGKVLTSSYSKIFGVPLAVLGLIHYTIMTFIVFLSIYTERKIFIRLLFLSSAAGLVFSIYLVFLQVFIIHAFCQYCLASALISLLLYFIARARFWDEYHELMPIKVEYLYKVTGKPMFFLLDPELVHDSVMFIGNLLGKSKFFFNIFSFVFRYRHNSLKQEVAGIKFVNPVGLAAGYDYTASFPSILPSFGFGFETIGTITNSASEGNKRPRLGRLIKSKSILVNKGFRNSGAEAIVEKLGRRKFDFNVGISIGMTNDSKIKTIDEAIADILKTFKTFENSKLNHSYYELNISCPNLQTKISFYEPKELQYLLEAISKARIRKPIFIKMPIEKSNVEVKKMLDVIVKHKIITGVIFGNLQKNRKDRAFVPEEVARAGKGNFSGKPTFKRSNELIKLAYKGYGKKFIIIGCGGVFSADDAYKKIKLGATLVQLITGMIFQGPQLISQINRGLVKLLEKDGHKNISEAVGVDA